METQKRNDSLVTPNVDHATVRSSTPSRTGEKKKKKNRESDLPHSQPTSQTLQKSTSKMDEDAGDIHDPTRKKKKWKSKSRQKKTPEYQ
jgi:hypothetical protein